MRQRHHLNHATWHSTGRKPFPARSEEPRRGVSQFGPAPRMLDRGEAFPPKYSVAEVIGFLKGKSALTDRWPAKAEYMHYELQERTVKFQKGPETKITSTGDTVKVGMNYHLGGVSAGLPASPLKWNGYALSGCKVAVEVRPPNGRVFSTPSIA